MTARLFRPLSPHRSHHERPCGGPAVFRSLLYLKDHALKAKPLIDCVHNSIELIGLDCELEMHSQSTPRSAYRCSCRRTLLSPTWAVLSTLLIVEQPSSHRQWAVEPPTHCQIDCTHLRAHFLSPLKLDQHSKNQHQQ
jgi:hypothetical protein